MLLLCKNTIVQYMTIQKGIVQRRRLNYCSITSNPDDHTPNQHTHLPQDKPNLTLHKDLKAHPPWTCTLLLTTETPGVIVMWQSKSNIMAKCIGICESRAAHDFGVSNIPGIMFILTLYKIFTITIINKAKIFTRSHSSFSTFMPNTRKFLHCSNQVVTHPTNDTTRSIHPPSQ